MRKDQYSFFICPVCGSDLSLRVDSCGPDDNIFSGELKCDKCVCIYPVANGIPRFVEVQNYASSFGIQWKLHAKTQIDKFNGTTISKERFYRESGWKEPELRGKRILECGSGAGRFTQIVLDAGAVCFSFDYSNAAEFNLQNNGPHNNLVLAQADIYQIPFRKDFFDYIFCFGVLQHTPDVRGAFLSMVPYLKSGGRIAVDAYTKSFKAFIHPKYVLRLITTRMNKEKLYWFIKKSAPHLLRFSSTLKRLPLMGKYLSKLIPVANYKDELDIPDSLLLDWAILDTFDWLSPVYDHPQTKESFEKYFAEAGLVDIDISHKEALVGRGKRA